jgi:hypothetical protein
MVGVKDYKVKMVTLLLYSAFEGRMAYKSIHI